MGAARETRKKNADADRAKPIKQRPNSYQAQRKNHHRKMGSAR